MPNDCCCLDASASLVTGLCQLALEIGLKAAALPAAEPPVVESLASVAEAMNRVAQEIHASHQRVTNIAGLTPAPVLKPEGVEGWILGL